MYRTAVEEYVIIRPPRQSGVVSQRRDLALITSLVAMVRACAASLAVLVCVDGLASYVTAFLSVFRHALSRNGRVGRRKLVVEEGLLLAQVVKRHVQRRLVSVERRIVRGTGEAIAQVLRDTGTGSVINTAYIERLNATFRAFLPALVRRGRAIVHTEVLLSAGVYPVGFTYNFCWHHSSLRLLAPAGSQHKWQERTPAMAAGLTDHCWSMVELLSYKVPLPAWVAPKRRGRPPKRRSVLTMAVAA